MVEKILFIEGSREDINGNLREGFHKLLVQLLEGNMPRIKMGNDGRMTVHAFKNNKLSTHGFLLIDLDAPGSEKNQKIIENELEDYKSEVFFMIQEMEAWFISQPIILDEYYGEKISQRIKTKDHESIPEPDKFLIELTRNTKRGKYHKVRHGVELLKKLDAKKLTNSSSEFSDLVKRLKSI